jgi:hypothetical protein
MKISPSCPCRFRVIAAVAGAALPKQPVDGVDLGPLLTKCCGQPLDRALFWHFPGHLGAGAEHAARDDWRTNRWA